MTSTITLTQLEDAGACKEQCDDFVRLFGTEMVVTEALCVEHAMVFDWNWAAEHLLSETALNVYNTVIESILDAYHTAIRSALGDATTRSANAFARAYLSQP